MLKVFCHHNNRKEEIFPTNGVYKVYELKTYELEYTSDSLIKNKQIYLEDIALDCSKFNISQLKISTIKPEHLFIDCFGYSSLNINNESFYFNVLIEKLKQEDAEEILMYLWKKDKKLYDIFLAKSSSTASNTQETEIGKTSKFINYAKVFYNKMSEYSTSFKALPYYVLRPQNELSDYSANLIDANSIPWILENLDSVAFSPEFKYDPDAIDFNGAYGIIDQILINKQIRSYKTYENNIILGSFLRLINKLNQLKKEINNNIDITRIYSEDDYVDFRDLKKLPYIQLLNESERIKHKLKKLYLWYKTIFTDALPQIERPTLTPVFIGRRHYANAFQLIQKIWCIDFDFQGDIQLFNIQKMSLLYELYNFYLLEDIIDSEMKRLNFEGKNIIDEKHAKYKKSYKKNNLTINFYYEPIYFYNKQSDTNLIRINHKEGTYYKPDFLLEFIYPNKENIYCILDAKYSQSSTARIRLNDCIYKYILNTGIYQNSYKKVDYLFTLSPINEITDYIINDLYYPQIGIIPSKPSKISLMQQIITKIINRAYQQTLQ